ncbi:unnamed protein product, partial [Meganyctiphanes norvegica]
MLKCRVCLGEYNDSTQRPLLLPACGHTFCIMCLKMLQTQGNVGCPECRKNNSVSSVDQLPVNFSVLSLAQAISKSVPQNQMGATDTYPSNMSSDPLCVNFNNFQSTFKHNNTSNSSKKHTVLPTKSSHLNEKMQESCLSYEKATNKQEAKHASQNIHAFGTAALNNVTSTNNLQPSKPGSSRSSHEITGNSPSSQRVKYSMDQRKTSELQEELDFQMAVHLTFCKDANHQHDEPGSSSCQSRDNLDLTEEEQLRLALEMSREEM